MKSHLIYVHLAPPMEISMALTVFLTTRNSITPVNASRTRHLLVTFHGASQPARAVTWCVFLRKANPCQRDSKVIAARPCTPESIRATNDKTRLRLSICPSTSLDGCSSPRAKKKKKIYHLAPLHLVIYYSEKKTRKQKNEKKGVQSNDFDIRSIHYLFS